VTVYRGTVLDTPDSPFHGGGLRAEADAGIAVEAGVVVDRGPFARVRAARPEGEVVDLTGGVLLPGLVDTHVHFPQVRVIGGLGKPLLSWLDGRALPEEARMSDVDYAGVIATDFVDGLARAGTTTALVFGAHYAPAVDVLFERAAVAGLRVTAGLVVGDRNLRPELEVTPERAYADGRSLADRWHGKERLRYAVTPRFSLATTPGLLESCAALLGDVDGALFTSHVNENPAEVAAVAKLFPECAHYVDTYDRGPTPARPSAAASDKFVSQEEYFPVFDSNSRDLQQLEASVVNNITEFYTYMKATRDSLRKLADMPAQPAALDRPTAATGEPDAWHDAMLNVIYLVFLGYESARKAVNDLIEFQPARAERSIVSS